MGRFRCGTPEPTPLTISLLASGRACDTAAAISWYALGTARQTAITISPALLGAAAAAALAMALACLGCSAAAVPAATDAISGTARAMAPTMAGAAAGLIPTAAFTTLAVTVCRARTLACKTKSADLAGSSAAGTAANVSLNRLAFGTSFPKELQATAKPTLSTILIIRFISLSRDLLQYLIFKYLICSCFYHIVAVPSTGIFIFFEQGASAHLEARHAYRIGLPNFDILH